MRHEAGNGPAVVFGHGSDVVYGWCYQLPRVAPQRGRCSGGRFFLEEVTRHDLERWTYRTFLENPEHDRFSGEEFVAEVERHGIEVGDNYVHRFFCDFVIGVGGSDER